MLIGGPRLRRAAAGTALVVCSVAGSAVAAQGTRRLFPARAYLPSLLGDPQSPHFGARFVQVTRSASRFGRGLEGDAILGTSIPVLLLAGTTPDDGLVAGVRAGVWARFKMTLRERDLISSDWVFAVPVVLHRGGHRFELAYSHWSAHLGDEYIERFEVERNTFTRDAVSALAFMRVSAGISLYGGGRYAYKVDPNESRRWSLMAGGELTSAPLLGSGQIYGTAHLLSDQDVGWDPQITVQTGIRFPAVHARTIRVATALSTGPSPRGQFHRAHETFVSLGFAFDL